MPDFFIGKSPAEIRDKKAPNALTAERCGLYPPEAYFAWWLFGDGGRVAADLDEPDIPSFLGLDAMIDSELQSKLEGYTQDVRVRAASKSSWKKHLKSWPVYTTAGGASLAMVASVGAGIIHSGPQNLTVNAPGVPGTNLTHINIGTGAGIDAFARYNGFSNSVGLRGVGPNSVSIAFFLRNVASGLAILGGGNFGSNAAAFVMNTFGATGGNFSPSNTGFAGVRLSDPMGTHFGWIRLHVNSASSMTVIDWAYNDVADAPINSGDQGTTAVPEPSTMTMVLLGAGSAGVLAWRRRRKEAAATPAA